MERQSFIAKDPITNSVLSFLRNNSREGFTAEEIAENIEENITTKQVQLVISLLMKEGMVRAGSKSGRTTYQIRA